MTVPTHEALIAFFRRLEEVWPRYHLLGPREQQDAVAGLSDIGATFEQLIDPGIDKGDLLSRFTGVERIESVSGEDVVFVDQTGETFYAKVASSGDRLQLTAMKVECAVCFGERTDPECEVCSGTGLV